MLLIHPPLAKACEPPAGIAFLAGFLRKEGQPCILLDANLEGQLHLLKKSRPGANNWSRRAHRRLDTDLKALRTGKIYSKPDSYRRAVNDLNRILAESGGTNPYLSLADHRDSMLSPLKSDDLLYSAAHPRLNIFYGYFAERLDNLLNEHSPSLAAFSINYLSQALTGFAMIGYLKKRRPDLPVAAGGGLITSWFGNPNRQNPFGDLIDHLVAGPGEDVLLKLSTRYSSGKSLTEKRREPNVAGSSYSQPDFSQLPMKEYLSPGPILPYATSTGCYWRKCSFCPETAENTPYRTRSPKLVLSQLEALVSTMNPSLIHFLDNALSPAMMQALVNDPPGPDWYSFARVERDLTDPGFCGALRRSGCVMLNLGLESGDQEVLDKMNKGIDLQMVSKVLANLKNVGIATYVYLLFGVPAESPAAARRTLYFTVKHSSLITYLNLAIFNMPRSAPEATDLAGKDFSEGDLSLYTDFVHPMGWERRKIRRFIDREVKRHPAITPIIRRDPPFFTSNHAPFFTV